MDQLSRQKKMQELDRNYTYFESILSELQKTHDGEFALIRNQKIDAFYNSLVEAQNVAIKNFPDGLYSIQEVKNQPLDLGFLSYVVRRG